MEDASLFKSFVRLLGIIQDINLLLLLLLPLPPLCCSVAVVSDFVAVAMGRNFFCMELIWDDDIEMVGVIESNVLFVGSLDEK